MNGPTPRTHCHHGHPWEGDNVYTAPDGRQYCRPCNRERSARYAATERGREAHRAAEARRVARRRGQLAPVGGAS